MHYKCPSCNSVGFGKSIIEGRCHFCDGTENGDGPIIARVGWLARHHEHKGCVMFFATEPHEDLYEVFDIEAVYTITEPM